MPTIWESGDEIMDQNSCMDLDEDVTSDESYDDEQYFQVFSIFLLQAWKILLVFQGFFNEWLDLCGNDNEALNLKGAQQSRENKKEGGKSEVLYLKRN